MTSVHTAKIIVIHVIILLDISLHAHSSGLSFIVALLWLVLLVMLQVHFWTYYWTVVLTFYHCRDYKDCFSPYQLARRPLQTQKMFIHSPLIHTQYTCIYRIGWIIQDNILCLTIIKSIALRDCILSLKYNIYNYRLLVFLCIFVSKLCVFALYI